MARQVQCNRCGYIFDSEEEEFGYCPCCENDQVEIKQNNSADKILELGKMISLLHIPKFLKITEEFGHYTYINLNDIVRIEEHTYEDEYLFYDGRGSYYRIPINEETSKVVEYLLNQLL